jgi:hypothetical protein
MKIKKVNSNEIIFDNGDIITFDHSQDCCEYNYADFEQIEEIAYDINFKEPLKFEKTDFGFRFGDNRIMFFVPCYSTQNGYYSNDVEIYFNGNLVLTTEGELN